MPYSIFKCSVKKIYTDSVLAKLSLPVPPELTDEEKELAKKFKIATSKLSKLAVRKKIKYFIENPPYEITEKDKARFVNQAFSSAIEVVNFLVLANDLGFISNNEYVSLREKIEKITNQLNSLYKKFNK